MSRIRRMSIPAAAAAFAIAPTARGSTSIAAVGDPGVVGAVSTTS